jgi:hypothetical protein
MVVKFLAFPNFSYNLNAQSKTYSEVKLTHSRAFLVLETMPSDLRGRVWWGYLWLLPGNLSCMKAGKKLTCFTTLRIVQPSGLVHVCDSPRIMEYCLCLHAISHGVSTASWDMKPCSLDCSKMLVSLYQTTYHMSEDSPLHCHCCENLTSNILITFFETQT